MLRIALFFERDGEGVQGLGIIGVDAYGAAESGLGVGCFAQVLENQTEAVMDLGDVRVDGQRVAEGLRRVLPPPLVVQHHAQVDMRHEGLGVLGKGLAVGFLGFVQPPGLMVGEGGLEHGADVQTPPGGFPGQLLLPAAFVPGA